MLLTIAYAWCLQHWAEKHNLPRNPDFCPWAESMRELWQTVQEYVDISYQDVVRDLEVEKPESSCLQPKTIFSQVLVPPANEQGAIDGPLALSPPMLKKRSSGVPLHPLRSNKMRGTC